MRTGYSHSVETRKKIKDSNTGKKRSVEARTNMSNAQKGKTGAKNSFFGKHHTEEWKRALAENKTRSRNISEAKKGKKRNFFLSEEQRRKIGDRGRGEKSNWWKGGITPINAKIRNSLDFKLWRESVFKRDNWTCRKCNKKGGKLHPHHIKNFAQFPELRFAIDNGITFDEKCHGVFHRQYGIKNNTKEQLEEYLVA